MGVVGSGESIEKRNIVKGVGKGRLKKSIINNMRKINSPCKKKKSGQDFTGNSLPCIIVLQRKRTNRKETSVLIYFKELAHTIMEGDKYPDLQGESAR